ncbi:MAG: hypothetical protein NUV69_01335 [Candidatus Curtissbacteria bacterium]|nr:hypothetical protein [Candidatus Curtissbacteria bacterium]
MKADSSLIRTLYLYGFSLVGLVLIVIGTVRLIDLGLKTYLFKQADTFVAYPAYPPEKVGEDSREMTEEERVKLKREQEEAEIKNAKSRKQATASSSIAMIIVGAPLFAYHWRLARKTF